MKIVMKMIRLFLGKIILFLDAVFRPRPLTRSPADQARLDERTRAYALYQFVACPFCVKVRRAVRRLNLQIALRDAQSDPTAARELREGGGQLQVPCLRITEATGQIRWLYESSEIIRFLEQDVAA